MKDLVLLLIHLLTTLDKLSGPGNAKAIVADSLLMKQRNPKYGYPKIAEQISKLFGIDINKDIVRRILAMSP